MASYIKNNLINLPFICVCHTASPTPHSPEIKKKLNGFAGCGRHTNNTAISAACTTAPNAIIGALPMNFIAEPNITEQIALTTPKHIITYPTEEIPRAHDI